MLIEHTEFVVIMQIVGGGDDADQTPELVLTNPDDLFLSANPTVVISVSTRAFTDC
jgi:hypothetical protein